MNFCFRNSAQPHQSHFNTSKSRLKPVRYPRLIIAFEMYAYKYPHMWHWRIHWRNDEVINEAVKQWGGVKRGKKRGNFLWHTIGFSKKGNPCICRKACVAEACSSKQIHAWPLNLWFLITTTSRIFPNCENIAYRHFFISTKGQKIMSTTQASVSFTKEIAFLLVSKATFRHASQWNWKVSWSNLEILGWGGSLPNIRTLRQSHDTSGLRSLQINCGLCLRQRGTELRFERHGLDEVGEGHRTYDLLIWFSHTGSGSRSFYWA